MKREIYKDIPEYEGIYQISNIGNVKSFKRYPEGRILKPGLDTHGYLSVSLCKNNKKKTYKIHQLVSITFLKHKPDRYKIVVDHINNIKTDNRLKNLQLISQRENMTKDRVNGSSIYTGVFWDKSCSKWKSSIRINKKDIHLGRFDNELEASRIYQLAIDNIDKYNNNNKQFREFLKNKLK